MVYKREFRTPLQRNPISFAIPNCNIKILRSASKLINGQFTLKKTLKRQEEARTGHRKHRKIFRRAGYKIGGDGLQNKNLFAIKVLITPIK